MISICKLKFKRDQQCKPSQNLPSIAYERDGAIILLYQRAFRKSLEHLSTEFLQECGEKTVSKRN